MINKNIQAIIRGHLIFMNNTPIRIEKEGNELYKTKFWTLKLNEVKICFRQKNKEFRIKYEDVTNFYLKDSEIFVFKIKGVKRKLMFKLD